MKKSVKILLIVAASLVVAGAALCGVALALGGNMNAGQTEKVTHTVEEPFDTIAVNVGSAETIIRKSETGKCYAVCSESDKVHYTLSVADGRLTLSEQDDRSWYDLIGIQVGTWKAELYLPEGSYEELMATLSSGGFECTDSGISFGNTTLTGSSGSIHFAAAVTGDLRVKTSSGSIRLEKSAPQSLSVVASSGSIKLNQVVAASHMKVETTSGSLSLDSCDGAEVVLKSSSGSIRVEDMTPGTVSATASSGSVKFERVVAAATMQVETSSGSVTLNDCDAAELSLECTSGSIKATLLTGKIFEVRSDSGSIDCPASDRNGGMCTAKTSSGSIKFRVAG